MATALIACQSEFPMRNFKSILEKDGHKTIGEHLNARSLLYHYQNLHEKGEWPDLVIIDMVMPDIKGTDAMKEIERIDPAAKIILSNNSFSKNQPQRAIDEGAKRILKKPWTTGRVMEAVNAALAEEAPIRKKRAKRIVRGN